MNLRRVYQRVFEERGHYAFNSNARKETENSDPDTTLKRLQRWQFFFPLDKSHIVHKGARAFKSQRDCFSLYRTHSPPFPVLINRPVCGQIRRSSIVSIGRNMVQPPQRFFNPSRGFHVLMKLEPDGRNSGV